MKTDAREVLWEGRLPGGAYVRLLAQPAPEGAEPHPSRLRIDEWTTTQGWKHTDLDVGLQHALAILAVVLPVQHQFAREVRMLGKALNDIERTILGLPIGFRFHPPASEGSP